MLREDEPLAPQRKRMPLATPDARRTAVALPLDVDRDVDRVSEKQAADHPLRAAHGIFTRFGRTPQTMYRFIHFAQFAARHAPRDRARTDAP
jgi:hypothetical protein